MLGLTMTRWESQPEGLFYTPSRWLAILIIRDRSTCSLRVVARYAFRQQRSGRSALAGSRPPGRSFPWQLLSD